MPIIDLEELDQLEAIRVYRRALSAFREALGDRARALEAVDVADGGVAEAATNLRTARVYLDTLVEGEHAGVVDLL